MSLNSEIILVSGMKIDKQYTNVLSYSENEMLTLCRQKQVASGNKYSFLRPTNSLYVDFTYSQCLQANYIAFQNSDYSNKWFFAWIDEVIYKGEKNCEIRYTVDAWSTWFSYWNKKPCFVNRQHVLDDTIGLNTIPENLNIGEVVEEEEIEDISYTVENSYWIAISCDWQPDDYSYAVAGDHRGQEYTGISAYNNQIFGNKIFLIEVNNIDNSGFINAGLFIKRVNSDGHVGDLHDIFIVPDALIDRNVLTSHTAYATSNSSYPFTFYTIPYSKDIVTFNTTFEKQYTFSNFQPKNNKCFVYPYNYLLVSNNNGSNNIYKYEDFATVGCVFENQLAMGIGVSGRLVPKNYKGMIYADDESLPLGKYPTCGWSTDSYTNWLTQNSINVPLKFAFSHFENYQKFNSGDIVGATVSETQEIAGIIGSFYSASLLPNLHGGGNNGNVVFGANKNCFTFRKMRAKTEYLRIIDDYFTRFGYKINRVIEPNIVGRTYWNYVEIGSSEVIGNGTVPANFMETINNACRKGVTIWHNHDNIGNYNLNNSIVTI